MPRGKKLSRAEHATIRHDWKTKSRLKGTMSERQMFCLIGETYGYGWRAIRRAVINHSNDNKESDDEHCAICKREVNEVKQEVAEDPLSSEPEPTIQSAVEPGQTHRGSRLLSQQPVSLCQSSTASASAPSLFDVIFVPSDDGDDEAQNEIEGVLSRRTTASRSPRKRRHHRAVRSSDGSDSEDERVPASPLADGSRPSKRQRSLRSPTSKDKDASKETTTDSPSTQDDTRPIPKFEDRSHSYLKREPSE